MAVFLGWLLCTWTAERYWNWETLDLCGPVFGDVRNRIWYSILVFQFVLRILQIFNSKKLIWKSTLINISINSCQTKLTQEAKPGNKLPYNIKMDVFIFMNLVVCEVTNHFNCWLRFKKKGSLTFKKSTYSYISTIFSTEKYTHHMAVLQESSSWEVSYLGRAKWTAFHGFTVGTGFISWGFCVCVCVGCVCISMNYIVYSFLLFIYILKISSFC